jgi:hypothetical protein
LQQQQQQYSSRTLRLKDKKLETRVVAEVDAVSSEKEAGAAMGVN